MSSSPYDCSKAYDLTKDSDKWKFALDHWKEKVSTLEQQVEELNDIAEYYKIVYLRAGRFAGASVIVSLILLSAVVGLVVAL